MRLCPACGNQYPDDANFCPMDASKLPPPAAAAPSPVVTASPEAATVMDSGATAIAGRFLVGGAGRQTPTGSVSDATDTQNGGAAVLLKLVNADVLPNAGMADRALRELKQLSKVASERIVKVVDQGRHSDGRVYVATEPVAGGSLEELVGREGALSIERATTIVLQVGEALTEAQKVGVIHRDVAPRNVYVGAGDKVKVGEFGLAEAVNDKVFGAPAFLSPEQVEGKPVDQRSNIYSLGAMFYFALIGKPPFDGDAQSLLQQQLNGTPQAPSARRPGLPAELDRIILKALEKSGGRRHLTLRQLLSEIEAAAGAVKSAAPDAASARTVMQMAPGYEPAAATPAPVAPSAAQSGRAMAATMMGIPMPGKASSKAPAPAAPPGPSVTAPMAAAPSVTAPMAAAPATTPSMTAAPAPEASTARTMMAEAPKAAQVASAATVMAPAPQLDKKQLNASPQVQAAVAAAQANVAAQKAAAQAAAPPPAKAGFRETAWFKAGEIQEEMEKAQAAAAQQGGGDPLAKTGTTGQHGVIGGAVDVNNVDVDAQDKARLSLKTGATQMMAAVKMPQAGVSGEQMDENEMLAEIDNSKKWFIIAGAVVGLVVLAVVLYFMLGKTAEPKAELPSPSKPEAVAGAPPAAPPPTATAVIPSPPPAAPPPVVPPPPAADNPASLVAEAQAAIKKGNLTLAVDLLGKAVAAGASAKDVKRLDAIVGQRIAQKLTVAKKKKDREGVAEANALALRMKSLKSGKKR